MTDCMDIEEEDLRSAPLGLYTKDEILPIFSTDIKADINDRFAKVKLTHIYYNSILNHYLIEYILCVQLLTLNLDFLCFSLFVHYI